MEEKSTNYLRLNHGLYQVTLGVRLLNFSTRATWKFSTGKTQK